MLKSSPRIHRANTPPTAAMGTALKMMSASAKDLNAKKSSTNISASAKGTEIISRALASCRFLKVPP